jgi:hypothetical protein
MSNGCRFGAQKMDSPRRIGSAKLHQNKSCEEADFHPRTDNFAG